MNSSFYTGEKRIPIPIAIITIFLLFILFSLGFRHSQKAKGAVIQQNLLSSYEVTNVTANSVALVVCLFKNIPLELSVKHVTSSAAAITIFDDRDIASSPRPRKCHYFSLKNIESGNYVVKPFSEGMLITDSPIIFQTGEAITNSKITPLWGKVVDVSDKPVQSGIVIVYFDNAKPMSTLIKNGDWLLPIHYLGLIPGNDTKFKILISGEHDEKTEIQATYKEVDKVNKTVILGKKYDFTIPDSSNQMVLGTETEEKQLQKIDIIYPQADSVIPSFRPLFKGVSLPNKKVTIVIDEFSTIAKKTKIKEKKYEVTANKDGVWTFVPIIDMAAGFHNIVITSDDEKGKLITVKRNYTILKSGEGVLGTATGSATLTPTDIPPPTPTEFMPSVEPTVFITPTPALPRSGMDIYPLVIMSVSFIVIGVGVMFFYL